MAWDETKQNAVDIQNPNANEKIDYTDWNAMVADQKQIAEDRKLLSAGMTSKPALTDNGDGTVDVASTDAVLYPTDDWTTGLQRYTIPAATNLTIADDTDSYIVVNYNSGSPIFQAITNVEIINESDIIPVYSIYREGIHLHVLDWDSSANMYFTSCCHFNRIE